MAKHQFAVGMDGSKLTTAISSDVTTLCHFASIAGITSASVYFPTITITVVGNFYIDIFLIKNKYIF